jgi:hypothetical protein
MIPPAPNSESVRQFVLRVEDTQGLRNYLIRRGHAKTGRGFDGSKSRRGKHELRRSLPSSEAEPAESISRAGPQRVGRGAGARTAGRKRCLSFGRE